jgi:hypothetical protein
MEFEAKYIEQNSENHYYVAVFSFKTMKYE